jgi:hypothetical protein
MKVAAGWSFGAASTAMLLVNWGIVVYFGLQHDPGSLHIWWPMDAYPIAVGTIIMTIGVVCGLVAGIKSSKGWLIIAALNACSFFFEWLAS